MNETARNERKKERRFRQRAWCSHGCSFDFKISTLSARRVWGARRYKERERVKDVREAKERRARELPALPAAL